MVLALVHTLVQITDCHLGNNEQEALLGLDTDLSLNYVLDELLPQFQEISALVCSGDISNDGNSLSPYQRLLNKLPTDIPQLWLPGNHDDNQLMQEAIADRQQVLGDYALGNWHITLLDSSIPRKTPGYIQLSELERALSVLQQYPDKYHMIVMHHHVQPVGSYWIDQQVVGNYQQVLEALAQYPQLKIISSGHVHQDSHQRYQHIDIFTSPSTCVQFLPNSTEFALDDAMPGLRYFVLHDDGYYETGVKRIAQRELNLDKVANGY